MEKLQAALQKARKSREALQTTGASAAAPAREPVSHQPVPGSWEELPKVELSSRVLKNNLVVSQQVSETSAHFDVLRTKILLQMQQNNWTRLAITSPRANSGKSTMACNLAVGFSRQDNIRSILFDCDLASPSVHELLRHETERSFSEVLSGDVHFQDQLLRIGDNTAVSASPRPEVDPTRLLLAESTKEILNQIEERYAPDLMIFDMPSMLEGDRVRAFLRNVDCAMIVIRADSTRVGEFDTCEQEVADHTNVLGTVLNGCRKGAL